MHSKDHLDKPGRCNKNGKCDFGYPKPLTNATYVGEDGRVVYSRTTPEDAWVVSYMPALTMLMDCHVNVDVCFTVNVFMYLYKYLFKGPDKTKFTVRREGEPIIEVDEIKDFVNARYLSASEACYRILHFHVTFQSPSVTAIPVHLSNTNFSQMRRNSGESSGSKLLRYMNRPSGEQFHMLKILDYYRLYRLTTLEPNKTLRSGEYFEEPSVSFPRMRVVRRQPGSVHISRLATVPLRVGELFYLRALLLHRPCYSFEDLRTIDDVCYPTFQQAAQVLGLFNNVNEAVQCLTEGISIYKSPRQLRFLFSQVIVNLPCVPLELWTQFQEDLTADYLDLGLNLREALASSLRDVGDFLRYSGSCLKDLGLPEPAYIAGREVREELEFLTVDIKRTLEVESQLMRTNLNAQQTTTYNTLSEAIDQQRQSTDGRRLFYIDGKAGRGKTYVLQELAKTLRSQGRIVAVCGSTALSATLYTRGRTAHSLFGIPVRENSTELRSRIPPSSDRADFLKATELFIWEEMPMSNKAAIECTDELLRTITGINEPFGGKLLVAAGDFRQVAPVVKDSNPVTTFDASIQSSSLWQHFTVLPLTDPVRNAVDPEFAAFVDQIGSGESTTEDGRVSIPTSMIQFTSSLDTAVQYLFPTEVLTLFELIAQRSFLSPLNLHVDEFNSHMLAKIDGPEGEQRSRLDYCYCDYDANKI